MPRSNPGRSVPAESHVAQRIAHEREARGLSLAALAQMMTDAGCPIRGTAIFKIEKGDPPRRVTVNELVAFCQVLHIPLEGENGLLTELIERHDYVSTACQHDLHGRCRKMCKFCEAKCRCACHVAEAMAGGS